ncbi:MAG TPA: hypothetical protein PLF26_21295, partial [Blastocatellia bacterium]|nr:hypothetical protein [Blastocatellia bacterium]
VDGGEVFRLAKNAAGSKWIVSTRTTSQPGGRTIASIWSDGAAHRIAVVNPDGEVSASVELR